MPQNTTSRERSASDPKEAAQRTSSTPAPNDSDPVCCDRCSGPMFRMRAVYWCTNCGYKTDCCGS